MGGPGGWHGATRMAGFCDGVRRLAAAGLIGAAIAGHGPPAAADEACPQVGPETVRLAAVEARLELRLADGRLLRLAGLDPALSTPTMPDRDERARDALARLLGDTSLTVRVLANVPDRWGRIVAQAFAVEGAAAGRAGGLATVALDAGLGRYLSEPPAHACRATLLAAETAARTTRLGLWADPYYALLAADDRAGFAERAGTVVVVEARLASVKTGSYRTSLIFAGPPNNSRGGQILSATILPRTKKIFEARGVHVSSLIGQSMRLRGLLDLRFGPQIELADPDDLDVVPAAATGAAPVLAPWRD